MSKFITTYENPDLDGVACCFAYAEYLRQSGVEADWGITGQPLTEVDFFVEKFDLKLNQAGQDEISDKDLILVDVSDLVHLNKLIRPEGVIEVIDHRSYYQEQDFPKAQFQVELVGACATLIAEKFINDQKEISESSARLLYTAILSNTINFKGKLTTERDLTAAKWLSQRFKLSKAYVQDFLSAKSIISQPLKNYLRLDYYGPKTFGNKKIGVAQLEMIKAEEFVEKNLASIREFLAERQAEENLDYVFLNGIDIEEGYNTIVATEPPTKMLLNKILDYGFNDDKMITDKVFMRKELIKEIDKILNYQ